MIRACLAAWLLLVGLLVGCGGATNTVPVANAGADRQAEVGKLVTLSDAGSSDAEGSPLSFAWALTSAPAGSTARLANPSTATSSFTPDVDGVYVIALVVNDGSDNSVPDSITVTATLSAQAQGDLTLARASALKAILTASTGTIRLEWQDAFPEGTVYRVEAQAADGGVSVVETVTGYGVSGVVLRSREIAKGAVAYRVQAVLPGRLVPLRSAASTPQIVDLFAANGIPQIVIDPAEPLSATTRISLDSARAFEQVAWSLDGVPIGNGGSGIGNPVARDFAREASGTHQVAARVSISNELSIDVQRDVRVSNAMPLVNLDAGYVEASAVSGIASVALSVNGVTVGTLTAPNACSPGPRSDLRCGIFNSRPDRYNLFFTGSTLKSGDYVLVYTVTDLSGRSVQRSSPFTVSNPPLINLTSPPDGALAHGSLRFRGSFVADLTGSVSVTASLTTVDPSRNPQQALSFQPILNTTGPAVDIEADLANIPPGTYSLSVVARNRGGTAEIKRTIVVTSTAALRYDPVFVGDGFGIASFVAEGDLVAYRDQNNQVRLVNVATGAALEVGILPTPLIVSGGRLYSSTWMPGCSSVFGDVCLFEWSLSGAIKPLAAGYSAPYFQTLARGSTVGWIETSGLQSSIKLYDTERGRQTTVTPPEGTFLPASSTRAFDFNLRDGQGDVFYSAQQLPFDPPKPVEIYRWSSGTGESRRITTPGMFNRSVMTDGARVAWSQYPTASSDSDIPGALLSQPVDGGTTTTLSSAVMHAVLRDGILAWIEATPTGTAIKASTSGFIQTIATSTDDPLASFNRPGPGNEGSTWLYDTSAGVVVYRQGRKFMAWSAATNQSRVVMDTADVRDVQVNGGLAFFTIGRSLYRVRLAP